VGEVRAGDEGHPSSRDGHRLGQRVVEASHGVRPGGRRPLRHRLVGEARQDGDDPHVPPARVQVLEEDGLELDGVLATMRDLGREEVEAARPARQGVDEVAVDGGGPERGVVRFAGEGERLPHPGMAGAEDDEQVGVPALGEVAIGPRVGGAAAMEVDVRGDHGAHAAGRRGGAPAVPRDGAGPAGAGEEPVHRAAQRGGICRVRAARVDGPPRRGVEEHAVHVAAPLGERRAVEKALSVEGSGKLADLLTAHALAPGAEHGRLDVRHRVPAVEERHDLEELGGDEDHGLGVPGGIAKAEEPPAVLLHGKGVDPAQARAVVAHDARKFRAEAA
jgi:hypothetical protein